MLSTRSARTLLAAAHSRDGLRALARALGFPGPPHPLAPRPLQVLGLSGDDAIAATRYTRGSDAALLIVEGADPQQWRETLHRLATRLDRLVDHRRWLVVMQCRNDGPLAIACWLGSTRGPRLAVLATSPTHVLDSDAQTVAALAAAWHPDPTLTCLRWHDLLGRHAIGRRFFRALDTHVTAIADAWPARVDRDDARTLALIHVARLLFLKFLEAKGWMADDRAFFARHTEDILGSGGRIWHRLIAPLTFGTLNTPMRHRAPAARAFGAIPFLNGGLFACSPVERRARRPSISDELLAPLLLDTLARYRFTAREEAQSWQEAAIDPDLLGRTFETLMDEGQRRGTGTFYTPASLVTSLVDDALEHAIQLPRDVVQAAMAGAPLRADDTHRLSAQLESLRVLDPACGSGSILVATLERIAKLRLQCGDPRPISAIRRHVLTASIFGVDIAPMAVWLCELRLWLSVVIDDESSDASAVAPLPNLDHHIRIGDSLGTHAFGDGVLPRSARLATLRDRYAISSGARKRAIAARIDGIERESATLLADRAITTLRQERTEILRLGRQRTLFGARQGLTAGQRRRLATLRTELLQLRRARRRVDDGGALDFDFRTHFADAAAVGGFDLVIGNPPWVRSHHLDAATRHTLRTRFANVTRHATGGVAFGVQTDLAIPFTQRALELTRAGGILAFLIPAKLWRSVSGGALRQHLREQARPLHLRDYSASAGGFAAAVYPAAMVLQRTQTLTEQTPMQPGDVECHATDANGTPHHFRVGTNSLPATHDRGAPWRIIPDEVRQAADTLADASGRWSDTTLPLPTLGIKTGYNDAFVLDAHDATAGLRPFTRPLLRGDHVQAWNTPESASLIVIPHDEAGRVLTHLPAGLARHFAPHERMLAARTDLRPREPWWSLFRTELLASHGWRVVWADIGQSLRATVLPPHAPAVPINSCYGVRLHDPVDAHALAALLNSPTTTAWLSLIAEPARGGYHRFMSWTVMALPMPPWRAARELLAPLAARARRGDAVPVDMLHQATLDAYGITQQAVAPLLAWTSTHLKQERSRRSQSA